MRTLSIPTGKLLVIPGETLPEDAENIRVIQITGPAPIKWKKMKKIIILLMFFSYSCTYKRDGEIIKTQDGKFYKLEEAAANESYFLREIDTSAINRLSK